VIRDKYNIIPKFMAAMLHALFIASLLFVFDFSMSETTARPLVIEATLVSATDLETVPPPVVEPPEPESEPDESEQERIEAEEAMRLEELASEQARIDAAEKKRQEQQRIREQEEAERKKQAREVEQRKKRQDDIERKRKENELARQLAIAKEAEDLRLRELADEEARLAAINSGAMARYQFALQQKIMREWARPASAQPGIECVVDVRQSPGGHVQSVTVGRCNGDAAVRRSIEAAVLKATPLPEPENRNLFDRDLRITFKPEE
jgi:colicin import membrane protein